MDRKRIAIFTTADYTWNFRACAAAVPELAKKYDVVGIYHFPEKLRDLKSWRIPLWYARVFGIFNFVLFGLYGVKQSFSRFLGPVKSWRALAAKYRLELKKGETPNSEAVCAWVKENEVDVVLILLNQILKKEILAAPRAGILNKHAGLLPACRGAYPFFWSRMTGQPTGVSYHEVDDGIDTGRLLLQVEVPPRGQNRSISMLRFYEDVFHLFPSMVSTAVERLLERRYTEPVVKVEASYYGLPTRQDYLRFRGLGHRAARISDLFYRA